MINMRIHLSGYIQIPKTIINHLKTFFMKKFLFLCMFTLGVMFSVNAQTKFQVDVDGRLAETISQTTYTSSEINTIVSNANRQVQNGRIVPVYVYVWDGFHWYQEGTYDFTIYPNESMDSIIDRLIREFF